MRISFSAKKSFILTTNGSLSGPSTRRHIIGELPIVIIARLDDPIVSERPVARSRIALEPMLVREIGSGTRSAFELFLAETATQIDPRAIEFSSNETIKQAVMAGLGIALISAHTIAMEVQPGRLVVLDVAGTPTRRQWFFGKSGRSRDLAHRGSVQIFHDRSRSRLPSQSSNRTRLDLLVDAILRRRHFVPHSRMMSDIVFRSVVFDLDGTVADTAPDLAVALNCALAAMGRRAVSLSEARRMIGYGTKALLRQGLEATGRCDAALIERGYPILMSYYDDHICDFTQPYEGIEQAMDELQMRGVSLALCTNKPAAAARRLVDALGWQARFAAIVGGDTLTVSKPDPAPLRLAIEQSGGGTAALVGDSIVDMATARAAGVPGIVFAHGYADRPVDQLGATAVLHRYDALVDLLTQTLTVAKLD